MVNNEINEKIYYLEDRIEKLISYVEYLSKNINTNINEIVEINKVITHKEFSFKYLDKIDIESLEQYIRKRKLKKLNGSSQRITKYFYVYKK